MAVQIEVAAPRDRFIAAAIDFVPPFLLFVILAAAGQSGPAAILALFSSIYLIFRDLIGNGQSPGKRVCNLQVVDTETDRVPPPMALIFRNLGFGVPGLNAVYAIVEGIRVLQHPQGLRFGDVFAETGVVKVPPEEREKLLQPKKDRPSREGRITGEAPVHDPTASTVPDATIPAGGPTPVVPPRAEPSGPKPAAAPRAETSAPKPVSQRPETPAKPPAPSPAVAPSKARTPIDLPDEPANDPTASTVPDAQVPKAAAPGVPMSPDDPLKKLIDQATKK